MTLRSTRRRFLQNVSHTALTTAAVATLGGVHASGVPAEEPVRLGIIGCGGIMGRHVS